MTYEEYSDYEMDENCPKCKSGNHTDLSRFGCGVDEYELRVGGNVNCSNVYYCKACNYSYNITYSAKVTSVKKDNPEQTDWANVAQRWEESK